MALPVGDRDHPRMDLALSRRARRPRTVAALAATAVALSLAPAAASDAQAASLARGTRAKLDRALARAFPRTWAPGVVAGVWVGDRGWTATAGTASREDSRRPRLSDSTRIGSVTKTMTGTLVLQLIGEGRLSFDDTIDRWFPSVPRAREITIRDLGTMASGITSYSADERTVDRYLARPRAPWTPAELIAISARLPRRFAPGDGFDYSNTNLVMLGVIVERITGRELGTVMRERIFAPLGMDRSTYRPLLRLPAPSLGGSTLQGWQGGPPLDSSGWNPTFTAGAGQVVSTLGDLRRWTVALGSGSLLTPALQQERLRLNPASVSGERGYAFAVGVAGGWVMHSGVVPGYSTQVAYLPSRRIAIVVLTNSDIVGPDGNAGPAIFGALAAAVAPGTRPRG